MVESQFCWLNPQFVMEKSTLCWLNHEGTTRVPKDISLGVPSDADARSAGSIDGQQKPWLQHVEASKKTLKRIWKHVYVLHVCIYIYIYINKHDIGMYLYIHI